LRIRTLQPELRPTRNDSPRGHRPRADPGLGAGRWARQTDRVGGGNAETANRVQ